MKRPLAALAALACAAIPLTAPAYASGKVSISASVIPVALQPLGHPITLSGSLAPQLRHATFKKLLNSATEMHISLALRARDRAGLDALTRSEYSPSSALYHHWLTPTQFASRFAPTVAQRRQIQSWLSSQGLRVTGGSRNGLQINAAGSAGRIRRAFGTQIAEYRANGAAFYANTRPVRLPSGLAPQIQAVAGLTNAELPHHFPAGHLISPPSLHHASSTPDGVSPAELQDFYGLKDFAAKSINGRNQNIAVLQLSDFQDADIATFDQQFGLPAPSIERVPVNGTMALGSAQGEAELDIEVIHSIAPAAHLLVYDANEESEENLLGAWAKIVSDDRANVISSSYGYAESHLQQDTIAAISLLVEEAAAQGQGILNASGDQGAYDASAIPDAKDANQLVTDFPATSPWVTAVGGTQLEQTNDGSLSEAVWGDKENAAGGGGGLSTIFKRPWYQVGPGVDNQYSDGMRQIPDVSALAGDGYAIYTVDDKTKVAQWETEGGTSASTPLWAAYAALLNQYLGSPVGFLNPSLYSLANKASQLPAPPFFDVADGDNLYYKATPGWDYGSGWGTLLGVNLAVDLKQAGAAVVHPSDFSIHISVSKLGADKKFHKLKAVKRGQKVSLLVKASLYVLPKGTTPSSHTYTFGTSGYTIVKRAYSSTVTQSSVGKVVTSYVTLTVPKNAPVGTYTYSMQYTVGGYTANASAHVQVR